MCVCVFTASGIDSYYTKNVIRVENVIHAYYGKFLKPRSSIDFFCVLPGVGDRPN